MGDGWVTAVFLGLLKRLVFADRNDAIMGDGRYCDAPHFDQSGHAVFDGTAGHVQGFRCRVATEDKLADEQVNTDKSPASRDRYPPISPCRLEDAPEKDLQEGRVKPHFALLNLPMNQDVPTFALFDVHVGGSIGKGIGALPDGGWTE